MSPIQDKTTMDAFDAPPHDIDERPDDGEIVEIDGDEENAPQTADDAEAFVAMPGGYRFSRRIAVLSDPTGVESSAVGALRNHLSQQHLGLGRRSLAICSASRDVNRSLVSANLAIAAAQAGASTVLVDANLREPELETFFQPPSEQLGLGDYLSGSIEDPAAIIRAEVLPNLSLVHAGTRPADPQALLSGRNFEDLITGLMRSFDLTIVDCPAARDSSDARRVASVLRYALIVVKRDVTYVSDVKRLIEDLTADRVTIVGTFLNVG